jgi:hypothetical protein
MLIAQHKQKDLVIKEQEPVRSLTGSCFYVMPGLACSGFKEKENASRLILEVPGLPHLTEENFNPTTPQRIMRINRIRRN